MKGLVIINAYPAGEKFLRQGERICAALRAVGLEADVIKNGEALVRILENGEADSSLKEYGFAIYLDKDKYLGRLLEAQGIRLFNSAKAVEVCDDKMLTYLSLLQKNIPVVESIPAPLCYTKNATPSEKFLQNVEKTLGYPLVAKKSYGSFGAGVVLVHDRVELERTAQEFLYEPHFYQRFEALSAGKDVRVIVIGKKAVAAMQRKAKDGEFRSNIELGGVGEKIELTDAYRKVAEDVASALDLDYCGVDLLTGERGPIVCEVNSNAFFEGLESVTGVDIALAYAKHVKNSLKNV